MWYIGRPHSTPTQPLLQWSRVIQPGQSPEDYAPPKASHSIPTNILHPTNSIPHPAVVLLTLGENWGFTQAGGELNCTREGDGKIEVVLDGVGGHQILYTWEPSNAPFYITDLLTELLTELRNGIDVNSFPSDYWGPGSGWRENNFPACLVCSQLSPRKRHCISISTHCMPS